MTANAAELQLQIDLVDIKFTSLQTQLNASLWVGWVPQIPMRNIRILKNPMHLFTISTTKAWHVISKCDQSPWMYLVTLGIHLSYKCYLSTANVLYAFL